jgi:hypothetical protein
VTREFFGRLSWTILISVFRAARISPAFAGVDPGC